MAKKSATSSGSEDTGSDNSLQSDQQKQAMYLAQETGHFSLVKAMHLADAITLVNGLSGCESHALRADCAPKLNNHSHVGPPLFEILRRSQANKLLQSMARICVHPSRTARRFVRRQGCKMEEEVVLDGSRAGLPCRSGTFMFTSCPVSEYTDSDQITFGVAPAAIAFSIGYRTLVDQLALTFYVLCGLTRLARFNVTVQMLPKDKTGKSKYFEGVPVPFACFTSSSITAYWSYTDQIHRNIPYGTSLAGSVLEFHPTVLIFIVCGTLMVCCHYFYRVRFTEHHF